MAIVSRDNFASAGIAHTFSETVARERDALITGDSPSISAIDFPVEVSQTLAGLNVVGLNGRGRLVPATFQPGVQPDHATGTATTNGSTTTVTIDGVAYEVDSGGANARASALAALINEDSDGPAYATVAAAVISLTARGPGSNGNGISLTITGGGSVSAASFAGGTGGVVPIGVLAEQVTTTATARPTAGVYVSGVFNPDRLVWDDSFNGEAARKLAFAYAPAYSSIIMRKIRAATVV